MSAISWTVLVNAALLASSAVARITPPTGGNIYPCHGQTCDNCHAETFSVNEGYPNCIVYNSGDDLGSSFSAKSGNGYDVWWDSGAPNANCKIVVRTPAATDLPACGYFLTSWSKAGCFYTTLQQTFMLQYCCGQGDCDAASPASSIADAHAQALVGRTTIVSLPKIDFADGEAQSGTQDIEGVGSVAWKRSDYAYSKRVADPEPEIEKPDIIVESEIEERDIERRSCSFHKTSDRTSDGGRQVRASPTQVCNASGGCSIAASATVTEGRSVSAGFSLSDSTWKTIGATVGYTFMESESFTSTTTYTQESGTTGYVTYIPTLYCWEGTFHGCQAHNGDHVFKIDSGTVYTVCNPATRSSGSGLQLDGTFSFVYVQS